MTIRSRRWPVARSLVVALAVAPAVAAPAGRRGPGASPTQEPAATPRPIVSLATVGTQVPVAPR
jgi:hypothetical protein